MPDLSPEDLLNFVRNQAPAQPAIDSGNAMESDNGSQQLSPEDFQNYLNSIKGNPNTVDLTQDVQGSMSPNQTAQAAVPGANLAQNAFVADQPGAPLANESMLSHFMGNGPMNSPLDAAGVPQGVQNQIGLPGQQAGLPNLGNLIKGLVDTKKGREVAKSDDDSDEAVPLKDFKVMQSGMVEQPTLPKKSGIDIDAGTGSIQGVQNLLAAYRAANDATLSNQLGAAGDKIAAALTHTAPKYQDNYAQNIKLAQQIPDQLQTTSKEEINDPKSPVSNAFRQYLGSLGVNVTGDFSAQNAKDLLPDVFKQFEGEQNRQLKQAIAEQSAAQREQTTSENNATKQLIAQIAANAKQGVADTNAEARKGGSTDKALQSAQQLLESARGNPAAAQAEKDLYSAQKANSLANLYGDPNKLSQAQVNLLASEIGKIAAGGVSSQHELDAITPNTLTGKLSTYVTKLTNNPTPANAAAFVKQYQDYSNALANDAKKVITEKYGRIIESRKHQLSPEDYQSLQDNYINRFKNTDTSSAPGPSSQPTTVIQNGHTYTLNPQTGQYE